MDKITIWKSTLHFYFNLILESNFTTTTTTRD